MTILTKTKARGWVKYYNNFYCLFFYIFYKIFILILNFFLNDWAIRSPDLTFFFLRIVKLKKNEMKNMCSINTNFDIIFVKEKEEVIKFQFRMKKLLLIIISIIKIFYFYVKWFHMMRGIKLSVFPLENDWKTYLSSKRFFVSGWFRVLKWFFMFLKAIN